MSAGPDDRCTGCGAPIDAGRVRSVGDVERFNCLSCGLQLVRRRDEPWGQIRG